MSGRRTVIGHTDVTDHIRAIVDQAPALSGEQADRIRTLFSAVRQTARPPRPARRHARRPAVHASGDAA